MFNMLKPLHRSLVKKIQSIALILSLVLCGISTPALAFVKSYKKTADGVTFSLDKGFLKVLIRRADIIEVKYTIFNAFETKPSLVVNNSWKTPTPYQLAESKTEVTITTAKLKVRV
ncbi:DUF4968 domain-containing protein, partial [Bradyrhizobium sp. 18BD]